MFTDDVTSHSPPALVCEGGVHARPAQHPDVALLGADGEQPLHRVPGHGGGLVGVAVHQRPLEAEVRRVDPLHDLGLHLVGDTWAQEGGQVVWRNCISSSLLAWGESEVF